MSSIRQYLIARRLLPQQLIRLDGELFGRLEALAAAQGRTVHDLVIETLYAAVYENYFQAKNDQRWQQLTPREQQVAALVCLGYTNQEIGQQLVISVNTVRSHVRLVLKKYRVASKAELRLILANWDFDAWLREFEHG
jgi:DNA-binding CsgD family transcriptional regulator